MKELILNNWMAKIMSLLLAITLWFLIKKNVETNLRLEPNRPVLAPETLKKEDPFGRPDTAEKPVRRAIPVDSPKARAGSKSGIK